MKNQNKFLYLVLIPLLASCSWTVPKNVSVKATDAEYGFRLGTFSKSLAEMFSADSINSMFSSAMQSEESSESSTPNLNLTVYDYNPDNKDFYTYLLDIPFNKMEFDLSKIIPENLDFENSLGSNITSPLEAQNISVPDLNEYLNKEIEIELPDFSSEMLNNINFSVPDISIPDYTTLDGELPVTPINVNVSAGKSNGTPNTIGTIDFKSGSLDITFTTQDNIPDGMEVKIRIVMKCDSGETDIHGDPIYTDISNSGETVTLPGSAGETATIHIPLSDKSINTHLQLSFEGSSFKAAGTNNTYDYGIDVDFSSDARIEQITGVTMELEQKIEFNQSLPATENDLIYGCTIGQGSLYLTSALPTGWTGVAFEPEMSLSGGVEASTSDFAEISSEDTHYTANPILNKKLILDNKTYSNAPINVNTSIGVSLENATLIFDDNAAKLTINIDGDIKSIKEAIINLKSVLYDSEADKSRLSYEITYDLDSGDVKVSDYINFITFLEETGLSIPYSNTLPEGNEIDIKYYSTFFDLGSESLPRSATIQCFGNQKETVTNEDGTTSEVNKIGNLDFYTDSELTIYPATNHEIDFTIKLSLPGQANLPDDLKSSSDAEYYGVLKNIELGKTYTIDIKSPKVSVNWKEIGINKSVIGDNLSNTIDTGIDFSTIFSTVTSTLGDSSIIESIKVSDIPAYIYCILPGLESFNDLGFSGSMIAKKINSETSEVVGEPIEIFDGEIKSVKSIPELVTNDKKVVIEALDPDKASIPPVNLSSILNDRNAGSLNIQYNLSVGGDGDSIVITKEQFEEFKNLASSENSSTCIELLARFILPMKLQIDPPDDKTNVSVDIMKIINGDKEPSDLFNREQADSFDDIIKYMTLIKSVKLNYSIDNQLLKYADNNSNISIQFDPNVEGLSPYNLNVGKGNIEITLQDFNEMMKTYPFTPDLKVVIPEGELQLPRKSEIAITTQICIVADGTIELFKDSNFVLGGE